MEWSYWEQDIGWDQADLIIIGGGIVGLNAALETKRLKPEARVIILDRGMYPIGASTRNAGFACFGSVSELQVDVQDIGMDGMAALVEKRWEGLSALRAMHGDEALDYRSCGGFELFREGDESLYHSALEDMEAINQALHPIFGEAVFQPSHSAIDSFGFRGFIGAIHNPFEGSLHPGRMMDSLRAKCQDTGIQILGGAEVEEVSADVSHWKLRLKDGQTMRSAQVILANNGWANRFIQAPVRTVRNQVLVTEPLDQPFPEHVFHMDRGYYYLRSVDGGKRVLIGGGRHRFGEAEAKGELGTTSEVGEHLQELLIGHFLDDFSIAHHWSGILGVGEVREPIIHEVEHGLFAAIRLGGMGVAIGTSVGKDVAAMAAGAH